jgi:hypothetical protein
MPHPSLGRSPSGPDGQDRLSKNMDILYMNENAEGNRMIREIQRQQNEKMRQQIKERLRKDLNAIGTNMIHDIQRQKIKEKLRKDLNAIGSNMIKDIQAQQKLARQLMQADTRKRIKPAPSRRQLNRQKNKAEVVRRVKEIMTRRISNARSNAKSNAKSKTYKKKYTV